MRRITRRRCRGPNLGLTLLLLFLGTATGADKEGFSDVPDKLRSPDWWLKRATQEAMKIESGPLKSEALTWIRKAQGSRFNPDEPIDERKADAEYFRKKALYLIRQNELDQAREAMENALRLYRQDEEAVPPGLFYQMAQGLAKAGRYAEVRELAERAPKRGRHAILGDRNSILGTIVYAKAEKDPNSAADLAEQMIESEANPLSFGFNMAIALNRPELVKKTAERGFEHIKEQETAYERTNAARRKFIMQLEDDIQQHHRKGENLSAEMRAAVIKTLDHLVEAYPEVGPSAADLYAELGEVDRALKIAKIGGELNRAEAEGLVRGLVKQSRYEEALKYAPKGEALGIVVRGYAEEGRYDKALEVAESIPVDPPRRTENKGRRRNTALSSVAEVQAKAGKVEQALATLDRIVPTKDWNESVKRRERSQAENQIRYTTRLVHMLTQAGTKDVSGPRKLLVYAKEKLKNVPEAGRDNAVHEITGASRAIEQLAPGQTGTLEELQKLAEAAHGKERIHLLAQIAAQHWDVDHNKASQQAIQKAKETARSTSLKPQDRMSAWLSIAVAEHRMHQEEKGRLKSTLDHAWEAAEQAIAEGKEDSVMVRVMAYLPFVRAYHHMDRWDKLPEAFEKIESPFDRALAFYTVGAALEREGDKLFDESKEKNSR